MGEGERHRVMAFGEIFFAALEVAGTISFAVAGAMAALEKRVDLFGVIFLGATTALAGGIIRDILVGKIPPSAFSNYRYMAIAAATALIVFLIARMFREYYQHHVEVVNAVNNVFDAAGLGAFTITGAKVAMSMGYTENGFFVVFLAMVTGIGGGVLRDLMIGEIPFVLRKRIYAVASILGGVVYYQLVWRIDDMAAAFIGIAVVFGLRMLATIFKWNLPKAYE
ncbi:trimeric intracellular cation channel family protein [Frisingicoccus sp.]|uniref:trimeric intracellular cation channel family protein n=1 Tax=Frisingicoccus sp. TaxID=1918627 RepID=UPI003AB3E72C